MGTGCRIPLATRGIGPSSSAVGAPFRLRVWLDPELPREGRGAMVAQHPLEHEVQFVTLHGHRRAYVKVGSGPAVLLLHGLGCDHTTWEPVIDALAKHYTVIAPDLLGHGMSAKPRADYSVGGYANGMRDLITV